MKVVFNQLTCWYQLPHVIGWSVMSIAAQMRQHTRRLIERNPKALTRFADVVVLLPQGNVVGGAIREGLGLRDRRRRRRHV